MPRISYVNGRYVRHHDAAVHIEDRGYQFADAVYEVIAIVDSRMLDEEFHLTRLERSLREIRMGMPFTREIFRLRVAELLRRNRLRKGSLYLQVSRGVAPRDHRLPPSARPSVVMTLRPMRPPSRAMLEAGIAVVTCPDIRWKRPDIKSVALLPNILARDAAVRGGAYEAWQVDGDGMVTEGSSTNAWIVTRDGALVTHPPDTAILNGVTRLVILELAAERDLTVEERPFSVSEALDAAEAFITSTTSFVLPVTVIDGNRIGDGKPGPVTCALVERYAKHAEMLSR